TAPQTGSPTSLLMGRWSGNTQYFAGSLDDLRIYSRALTQPEISSEMGLPVDAATDRSANPVSLVIERSETPSTSPFLAGELGQVVYGAPAEVRATVLRVANPTAEARAVELKTWLQSLDTVRSLSSRGNDGLFVLGPGEDNDFGPALVLANVPNVAGGPHAFG